MDDEKDKPIDYSYKCNQELFQRYSAALISGGMAYYGTKTPAMSFDELIGWSMKTAHKMVVAYHKALPGAD